MRSALPFLLPLLLLVPLAGELRHGAPAMLAEFCDGHLIALDAQGKAIPDHCADCMSAHAAIPITDASLLKRAVRVRAASCVAITPPSIFRITGPSTSPFERRVISLKG